MKHGRLAHVRSQFSLFRRSPTHKNLPLATFCTSEHAFWLLFARRKKVTSRSPFRELRGSANLVSAHRNCGFARTKLKPSQRELRGSANLEAARRKGGFALTKLNPLPLRGLSAALGGILSAAKLSFGKFVPFGTARPACYSAALGGIIFCC